jgi:hypothetical protein
MTFNVWTQAKIMNGFEKIKSVPSRQENLDITLEDFINKILPCYNEREGYI